ncbi:MAG: ABC transporter permease [Candidatus Nanoarchaeia archaeon]
MNNFSLKSLIPFYTLVKREVGRFMLVPIQTVIPSLITTLLYVLIFGFTLGSRIQEISGVPYIVFIVPGLVMLNVITAAYANSSSSMTISKYMRNLENILIAPVSYFEFAMAYVIGAAARGFIVGIGTLIIAALFIDVTIHSIALSILITFLASVSFASLGLIIGIWADNFDQVSIFPTFILTPLTFLGGVFYSIELLPELFRNISLLNPIFHVVNTFRFSILGITDFNFGISFLVTIVLTLVPLIWAIYLLKIGYKIKD